jgi:hypothetical protein
MTNRRMKFSSDLPDVLAGKGKSEPLGLRSIPMWQAALLD